MSFVYDNEVREKLGEESYRALINAVEVKSAWLINWTHSFNSRWDWSTRASWRRWQMRLGPRYGELILWGWRMGRRQTGWRWRRWSILNHKDKFKSTSFWRCSQIGIGSRHSNCPQMLQRSNWRPSLATLMLSSLLSRWHNPSTSPPTIRSHNQWWPMRRRWKSLRGKDWLSWWPTRIRRQRYWSHLWEQQTQSTI